MEEKNKRTFVLYMKCGGTHNHNLYKCQNTKAAACVAHSDFYFRISLSQFSVYHQDKVHNLICFGVKNCCAVYLLPSPHRSYIFKYVYVCKGGCSDNVNNTYIWFIYVKLGPAHLEHIKCISGAHKKELALLVRKISLMLTRTHLKCIRK